MNKKIQIIKTDLRQTELILNVDTNDYLDQLIATGQMLVDSEGIAFIYLLEKDDNYVYLVIQKDIWNDVKQSIKNNIPVYVSNGTNKILLDNFKEEIEYLIENIQGNGNYGEEMVKEVEASFQ